ncbi:MAG: hypothetical protein H6R18_245 [Proteobacteria bacterium]|nr:hypothetical protein [Pseudomonadota bacterium]
MKVMPTPLSPDPSHVSGQGEVGEPLRGIGIEQRAHLGANLLILARNAIGERFGVASWPIADLPELHTPGATFVTLMKRGSLRGCIGTLSAYRPLIDDVRANACAAAFSDPRFAPVDAAELPVIAVEVSLLTVPTPLSFTSEADALAQLQPNIDGVILRVRHYRATFLPQVWEQLPDAPSFMAHLKQKAGLPADYWSPDVVLERYQVEKWKETSA